MAILSEKLTKLRTDEQAAHGYATSSRWYTSLSYAISFLERAETTSDFLQRFSNAWFAVFNLTKLYGPAGDEDSLCFNRWTTEVMGVPGARQFIQNVPLADFVKDVERAKRALLYDTGRNCWRQSYQYLNSLPSQRTENVGTALRYFLLIIRDIRNACSHPEFNPKGIALKKALTSAADCLIPLASAAIQATIEHPPIGTTGRTTAYRSFLWPFIKNSDSFLSDYYLERLFQEGELADFSEDTAKNNLKELDRHLQANRAILISADKEMTDKRWNEAVLFPVLDAKVVPGVCLITDDGVFEPSYAILKAATSSKNEYEYHGKEASRHLACLIWTLPWHLSLDAVSSNPAFEGLTVIEVAHRALTGSDVNWAVIANGQKLRLLNKGTAHKPRCYLEIDLTAILDRRVESEAVLAFRYCLGLFSGSSFTEQDANGRTRLDRVLMESERHGKEIGDELKQNVFSALEELGDGFLHYMKSHPDEAEDWRKRKAPDLSTAEYFHSDQLLTDIYHESLSLMYRLLFLFYAESRNLLPMENEMYRESYSLELIRDDIISVLDDPDPKRSFGKGTTLFWDRLQEFFHLVNTGWQNVIPVYDGGLFDPGFHEFLERLKIDDYFLPRAIDLLSRTKSRSRRDQARGEGRKKVTYRDLDVRHLGSIYEGILEYHACIANQDMVVIKRGSGNKVYEEYTSKEELNQNERQQLAEWQSALAEDADNPKIPVGCKILGYKEKGRYFLVYGGRESKRKSTGSYYTPDYIVQYIVDNTLGPLVRGKCRPQPEAGGVLAGC
jgi:hypothetical protein